MHYDPLLVALEKPVNYQNTPINGNLTNTTHFDIPGTLHIALNGIFKFFKENSKLPELKNESHIRQVTKHSLNFFKLSKLHAPLPPDDSLFDIMPRYSTCEITSITSFLGGVAGQEILKIVGTYIPLNQWLFYEAKTSLPDIKPKIKVPVPEIKSEPKTRYSDYVAIYGKEVMDKIADMNIFLIGAGALGCEYMKGLALMGACTSKKGCLYNTDNDHIEATNLNRQFLYRYKDINHPKSEVAAEAIKKMNKEFNVVHYTDLVCDMTENKFDNKFWEQKDLIIGAVDNMDARRYTNRQCLRYGKSYLESATTGTKSDSEVILNGLTASFTDAPNPPPDDAIPVCTLKIRPTRIEHTIEWAKAKFERTFKDCVRDTIEMAKEKESFVTNYKTKTNANATVIMLGTVLEIAKVMRNPTLENFAKFARKMFEESFVANIKALLKECPPDDLSWSTATSPPKPAVFNINDSEKLHSMFIMSCVKLVNQMLNKNIQIPEVEITPEKISKLMAEITLKTDEIIVDSSELKDPSKGENSATSEDEKFDLQIKQYQRECIELMKDCNGDERLKPISFEKDDDTIIEFVHSASSIRALSYNIHLVFFSLFEFIKV